MELMDVLEKRMVDDDGEALNFKTLHHKDGTTAWYEWFDDFIYYKTADTLPNSLADFVIWVVENWRLTFDKR